MGRCTGLRSTRPAAFFQFQLSFSWIVYLPIVKVPNADEHNRLSQVKGKCLVFQYAARCR